MACCHKEPASTSVLSSTSDILPTLAEMTGQPLPDRPIDGISLVPFLMNPQNNEQNRFISGKRSQGKLEGQSPHSQGFEMYDIQNDSKEKKNLAGEHPEKVKEMNAELRKWQESVLNSLTGADYK
jgi:arylsulfatase A-like enzyme